MRRFRPRFTVRRLMVVVAVSAVLMAAWAAWFDPVRVWRRAVVDDENGLRRWEALNEMSRGRVPVDVETALDTFDRALWSPSYRIRETAVRGLGRLGPSARPALSALIAAMADPEAEIRGQAAGALIVVLAPGDAGRAQAAPALMRLLGDHSPTVRMRAATTLVEFGRGRDALPVLLEALRRPDYAFARGDALYALGKIGPPAAPEALPVVKWLESQVATALPPDPNGYLRIHAPEARYFLGDRAGGLAAIRALADGPEPELAREAQRILTSPPPYGIKDEPVSDPDTP